MTVRNLAPRAARNRLGALEQGAADALAVPVAPHGQEVDFQRLAEMRLGQEQPDRLAADRGDQRRACLGELFVFGVGLRQSEPVAEVGENGAAEGAGPGGAFFDGNHGGGLVTEI